MNTKGTLIDAMIEAGGHYGYTRTRRHPSVKQFLYATKDRSDLIDLSKTETQLETALKVMADAIRGGKQILFSGNKPEAQQLTKEVALALRMPYSTQRWIGGTLTNFSEIKKRIEKLQDLLDKKEKGELSVYTKKERLLIDRSIEKMDQSFGGLSGMKQLPAVLFVVDSLSEDTAVKEANFLHIPVISLSNTDCNVDMINYPVVMNDSSQSSLSFFLKHIEDSLKDARNADLK